VNRVVRKRCISAHVMRAVAAAIGRPVEDVYPEYYRRGREQQCA
jgi:hypothetical protein